MANIQSYLQPLVDSTDFEVLPLAGDASSRRYYRVVAQKKSWVLMEWEPFEKPQDFPFLSVQTYFAQNNISVPKIYDYNQKAGLFLLEDLGDLTLERKFWEFQNQENILPYYKKTIDQLIQIHSLNFLKAPEAQCTAYDIEFSTDKLMWEFEYMMKHLSSGLLKLPLSESQSVKIKTEFHGVCQKLSSLPQVICHRDFHSRNVMLKHGQVYIIDFQDARMGPAVYDMVSLLYDSYVDLKDETTQALLKYYAEEYPFFKKISGGYDSFLENFYLQSLQRCLKACGSFSSFYNDRGDERYLKYIGPTLKLVQKNLLHFPELKALSMFVSQAEETWAKN